MVTIDLIRLENARRIIEDLGGPAKASRTLDIDPSQLSQIAGPNPTRNIGPRQARKIEVGAGRPKGWLDVPHAGHQYGIAPDSDNRTKVAEPIVGIRRIPIVDMVTAGRPRSPTDPYPVGFGSGTVDTPLELSDGSFALTIDGMSMAPLYQPGDHVIIDPESSPRPGDCVVAVNSEHEATFKKYRPRGRTPDGRELFELVPLNDDYETYRSDVGGWRIIGTEAQHIRYNQRHKRAADKVRPSRLTRSYARAPLFDQQDDNSE